MSILQQSETTSKITWANASIRSGRSRSGTSPCDKPEPLVHDVTLFPACPPLNGQSITHCPHRPASLSCNQSLAAERLHGIDRSGLTSRDDARKDRPRSECRT